MMDLGQDEDPRVVFEDGDVVLGQDEDCRVVLRD